MAAQCNVKLKSFRCDNHPFASRAFLDDLEAKGQEVTYCGVGAHHQNGLAENSIRTVTTWARALMMNQLIHWPEVFDEATWPMALEHAVFIWNNLPREDTRISPNELFSNTKCDNHDAVLRSRVWGCPAYVLHPKLQTASKIPRWTPRTRQGVYLGQSSSHHGSVGRILNPRTGHISPQWHIVFDELFQTVWGDADERVFDQTMWNSLLQLDAIEQELVPSDRNKKKVIRAAEGFYHDFFEDDNLDDVLEDDDLDLPDLTECTSGSSDSEGEDNDFDFPKSEIDAAESQEPEGDPIVERYRTMRGRTTKPVDRYQPHAFRATLLAPGSDATEALKPRPPDGRSEPHKKYLDECYLAGGHGNRKAKFADMNEEDLHGQNWNPGTFLTRGTEDTKRFLRHMLTQRDDGEAWHPSALAAKGQDPENNPTWEQAMNGPLREGYMEAARKEIATLVQMGVWEVVDRESWMNILPSVWAFKKKLYPDGSVRKLKARICAGGHRQKHGVDYWSTFAPTVSWSTVRLLLILSVQMGLATKQVDYTAAFVHADIDLPPDYDKKSEEEKRRTGVFVEMARGFSEPGKAYKLKKSLYGLHQCPRNFFLFLKAKLEAVGFEQASEIDSCLFISDKVVCLIYVDDTLLFARNQEDIDEVLYKLVEEQGMALEVEDSVAGFLGVLIKHKEDRSVELVQEGLTDRIIKALGVEDLPAVATPSTGPLGSDEDGEPMSGTFNYASVIGMLWYLYSNSRPEIGYAVSSAARFAFKPKRSHELALLRIGQYLKGTRTRGLIMKPLKRDHLHLEIYVDSDFMGLYGTEKRTNPDNVKSRAGHIMLLNGCPIIWSSKLMQSVCLSTMMAEYYALSAAMKEALPLLEVIKSVADGFGIDQKCVTEFKVTIWEDNMGALTLANNEPGQHTIRSKFYDVRVHWFRNIIHEKDSGMTVAKVDTKAQLADLLTKALPREPFERLRKELVGW